MTEAGLRAPLLTPKARVDCRQPLAQLPLFPASQTTVRDFELYVYSGTDRNPI